MIDQKQRRSHQHEMRVQEYWPAAAVEPLDDGDFRIVFIAHGLTADGQNYYPERTLREAAEDGVFDGAKMYLNHSDAEDDQRGHRDMGEWAGVIKAGTVQEAGGNLTATAHVNHPDLLRLLGDPLTKDAVGISHDSWVRYTEKVINGQPVHVIDEIVKCNSVDWVPEGNAHGRVIESRGDDAVDFAQLTQETLQAERPDLVQAIAEAAQQQATDNTETEEVGEDMTDEQKRELEVARAEAAEERAKREKLEQQIQREEQMQETAAKVQALVDAAEMQDYEAARVMERFHGAAIAADELEQRVTEAIAAERKHTEAVLQAAGVQTRVTEAGQTQEAIGTHDREAYEARHKAWCREQGVPYFPLKEAD